MTTSFARTAAAVPLCGDQTTKRRNKINAINHYLNSGWKHDVEAAVEQMLQDAFSNLPPDLLALIVEAFHAEAALMGAGMIQAALVAIITAIMFFNPVLAPLLAPTLATVSSLAFFLALAAAIKAITDEGPKVTTAVEIGIETTEYFVCDPNALTGPGEKNPVPNVANAFDGGPIHAGERASYVTEFENVGTASVRKVQVDVPLSSQLDYTSLQISDVRVGDTDVTLTPEGSTAWPKFGTANVPINGTTNKMAVRAEFTPCVAQGCTNSGLLRVSYYGMNPIFDSFGIIDEHSDFLPPNTTPPQGQGFFTFSANVMAGMPVGSTVFQDKAEIRFDPHEPVPPAPVSTNSWQNTVAARAWTPGDHVVPGLALKLGASLTSPSAKKLQLKIRDLSLQSIPDPRTNAVTLVVKEGAAQQSYSLPAANWQLRGTKYAYKDSHLLQGPIKSASFDPKTGYIKLVAKGVQLRHSLTPMPDKVDVILTIGGDRVCAEFGGTIHVSAGRSFVAIRAPAPAACAS
jgi:hypothetical protein